MKKEIEFLKDLSSVLKKHDAEFDVVTKHEWGHTSSYLEFDINSVSCNNEIPVSNITSKDIDCLIADMVKEQANEQA